MLGRWLLLFVLMHSNKSLKTTQAFASKLQNTSGWNANYLKPGPTMHYLGSL